MMNYKECLARGFPISTGAIESACGHFVQSRMERNGMRWSLKGAKNMLNLRAVNKNKDWDTYMRYYMEIKQVDHEISNLRKLHDVSSIFTHSNLKMIIFVTNV